MFVGFVGYLGNVPKFMDEDDIKIEKDKAESWCVKWEPYFYEI